MASSDPLVTMSQIASLAGVRPSAVSNWRTRHEDFPRPAETGPAGRDLFNLSEIDAWLRRNDRGSAQPSPQDRLWYAIDAQRGRGELEHALQCAGAALALRRLADDRNNDATQALTRIAAGGNPVDALADLFPDINADHHVVQAVHEPLAHLGPLMPEILTAVCQIEPPRAGEVLDDLLERRTRADTYGRSESSTSTTLRALLVALANPNRNDVVFDPAAGEAGLLIDASKTPDGPRRLAGQEVNEDSWRIGAQRLMAHGLDTSRFEWGDSLHWDELGNLRASLVICDPPYGQSNWGADHVAGDERWQFGIPNNRNAEMAWIQHAIHHLAPDGRAFLLTPAGTLFRGGSDGRVRRELIRQGAVEAIIQLPPGLADRTSVALAVWILRAAAQTPLSLEVLLVNASDESARPSRSRGRELSADRIRDLAGLVRHWQTQHTVVPGPVNAVAVPISGLLSDKQASLVPSQWMPVAHADREQALTDITVAIESLAAAYEAMSTLSPPAVPDVRPGTGEPAELAIRDLAEQGVVTILQSRVIAKDEYTEIGTPVLTQAALARGTGPLRPDRYVDFKALKRPPVLTEPGDVILATIGDHPFAVVDEDGGRVLGGSLQALRIHADWLDPVVVAACLSTSATAQRAVGVAIRHVKLRELSLPRLSAAQTAQVRAWLEELRQIESTASDLASTGASVRNQLMEGIAAGAVQVVPEERDTSR